MSKIYYFYSEENKETYFFSDLDCANFYRFLLDVYKPVNSFQIKFNNFEGTDVYTLYSFKEKLKKDSVYFYNSFKLKNIHKFIIDLENKIREEKLKTLLNE